MITVVFDLAPSYCQALERYRVHVTPKTVHRMTAIEDCDIFEVSTPELDDVVRLEDRYGREDGGRT
jgi:hypothetical protein